MTDLPAHSPLGASSAERWMNCPGSVALLKHLQLPESDEPEYRTRGVCAHAAAAQCLADGSDAWELIGQKLEGYEVDADMANAVQVYLDTVRPLVKTASAVTIEEKMHRPDLHPLYFGTADLALYFQEIETLDVTDYKNGVGIVVEPEWNAQIMYYARGLLDRYPGVRTVKLRIVQPNAFHEMGSVREWTVDAETLVQWGETELLPAMVRAEIDDTLDPGPWCRFCPAKLVCPVMKTLFGAAMKADPKMVVTLDNESLGRDYQYIQAVEFYLKAVKAEVYRLNAKGDTVPGTKLVAKKANRVYRSGADAVFKARFGAKAMTDPELKSPAEMEKVDATAKELMKEWAYTPLTGFTVALESDKRAAVKIQTSEQAFGDAARKLLEAGNAG